ncbi:MAG: DUF2167 domain-containing protein [Bacteroidota bacterium]
MKTKSFFIALFLTTWTFGYSSDSLNVASELSEEEFQLLYQQFIDSVAGTLVYEFDSVELKNGVAHIKIPSGFKFLNGKDSDMILTDIWGNPPSEEADKSMGMIIPEDKTPFTETSYVINITYSTEGYIDDSDAKDIDYDDLLESMQADTEASNEYRIQAGYPTVDLIGWASTPFYNSESKKLHWAKELKFQDTDPNTLNYSIRILGRKGYLELNAIGSIDLLDKVTNTINPVIESVNFNKGYRYADFNPEYDKIAAYGIGGLIAGKVLAKAGILAKIGIFLAKFWKFLLIGVIAFFGAIRKFFGGKSDADSSNQNPIS